MYNLLYLVRKDLFLVRKFMLLLILYYIYMAAVSFESFSLFTALPSILLLINSCSMDILQKNQRLLVSLPVRRQQIVLAKYVSILPSTLFGAVCVFGLYLAGSLLGKDFEPSFWKDVAVSLLGVPLYIAIYLPVFYWLGDKGKGAVNIVFMMISLFATSNIVNLVNHSPRLTRWAVEVQDHLLLQAIVAIAYILIMSVSYMISLRIFKGKDL